MSRSFTLTGPVLEYVQNLGVREHPALVRCREDTQRMADASMQVSAEQGAFMQTMVAATHARRAVEVGVFTGYSSLAVALTMKELHGSEAKLIACDISEDYARKARDYWREAGVDDVIDLRIGSAIDTLDRLIAEGGAGTFDLAFIDADKTSYGRYYEQCLELLRRGGMLLVDNMLWSGDVADPTNREPNTAALRELAKTIHADKRVIMTLATIGDGVSIVVKR
ncbi:MAG: O-methyltransferase [Myxococcota bacterium]